MHALYQVFGFKWECALKLGTNSIGGSAVRLYRSLIVLCLVSLVSVPLLAAETETKDLGFWVEAQGVAHKQNASSLVGMYSKDLTDSVGLYALALKQSDGYSELYVGPTFKFSDRLTVGTAIGHETVTNGVSGVRRNVFVDANWRKFTAFATFENGASGPWHKGFVTYKVTEKVNAGVMEQSVLGLGPRVEYHFDHKNKIAIWGAVLHSRDTGATTPMFGINASF
ncbi:MAG: hypothetical protein Q8L52_01065 [bacterium]|nr:hypothetical protein [bacterium]